MRLRARNSILIFIGFLLFAGTFGTGFATAMVINRHQNPGNESEATLNLFWEAWNLVERDFYGELPEKTQLTYSAIQGSLTSLNDPYTILVEPQPREMEKDSLRGSFGGIGAYVSANKAGEIVLSPIEEQPAAKAGILEGDVLLAIDGEPIDAAMTVDDVVLMIRGPVGEVITLRVRHPGESATVDIPITRAIIELPSASWNVLDQDPSIGYIQLTRFTERSAEEVNTAIQELQSMGAESLILDLRYNGGGLLNAAVDVLDHFLDSQVVLHELQSGGKERSFKVSSGGSALETPLVILVNGGTASASEIVAGALQDLERATLIGEKTFGKGSVQHIHDLSDGSSLHVTAARWFTPNRRQLDENGLEPDIALALDESGEDNQLERAIIFLQNGQ